jgi:hypothetical protein
MLARCRAKLEDEDQAVGTRVELVQQDITRLALDGRRFPMAIIAFNSLLCITEIEAQRRALESAASHLIQGGVLVLDVVNPLSLNFLGDSRPTPFFTRRINETGNTYTRFAMMGPFDSNQKQRLHGWYDEVDPLGAVKRTYYSLFWRPIFRFELELMLEMAGLEISRLEGGHGREPFTSTSPRLFVQARRVPGAT